MEGLLRYKVAGVEIREAGVEIPSGVPTFIYDDYKYVEVIGQGGVGISYKVVNASGKYFTMKRISILPEEGDDETHKNRIMHDMHLATSISHANVMRCLGVCKNEFGIYFLYEFMPQNMCRCVIRDQEMLSRIAYQVLSGLRYLRKEKRIVFKHLTPGNILRDPDSGLVKIADVGVVKDKYVVLFNVSVFVSYIMYIAPENYHVDNDECDLQSERYGKSDTWSLGLCLLQFYMGKYPYDDCDDDVRLSRLLEYLLSGENFKYGESKRLECEVWPPRPPSDAPPLFRDFISLCLNLDVSQRADVDELLNHEFITSHCSVGGLDNAHLLVASQQFDSSDDTNISDDHMYDHDHLELAGSLENDIEHQDKKPRLSVETVEEL